MTLPTLLASFSAKSSAPMPSPTSSLAESLELLAIRRRSPGARVHEDSFVQGYSGYELIPDCSDILLRVKGGKWMLRPSSMVGVWELTSVDTGSKESIVVSLVPKKSHMKSVLDLRAVDEFVNGGGGNKYIRMEWVEQLGGLVIVLPTQTELEHLIFPSKTVGPHGKHVTFYSITIKAGSSVIIQKNFQKISEKRYKLNRNRCIPSKGPTFDLDKATRHNTRKREHYDKTNDSPSYGTNLDKEKMPDSFHFHSQKQFTEKKPSNEEKTFQMDHSSITGISHITYHYRPVSYFTNGLQQDSIQNKQSNHTSLQIKRIIHTPIAIHPHELSKRISFPVNSSKKIRIGPSPFSSLPSLFVPKNSNSTAMNESSINTTELLPSIHDIIKL